MSTVSERALSPGQLGRYLLVVVALAVLLVPAIDEPELFATQVVGGFVFGLLLILMALGLTLIFGLMGIVNFAHGAMYMLGAYLMYELLVVMSLPFWLALPLAAAGVGLLGVVIELTILRLLYDEEPIIGLLATFGLTYMIDDSVEAVWGTARYNISPHLPSVLDGGVNVSFLAVSRIRLFTIVISSLTILALYLVLSRTQTGLTIRAGVQDREMTTFLGVRIPVWFTGMFFVGAAFAGLAGALRGSEIGLNLGMGTEILVFTFIIVVVGGIGSFKGSIVAGLIVGESLFLTPVVLQSLAEVTNVAAINVRGITGVMPYLILIVVLLLRPQGLYGEEGFLE